MSDRTARPNLSDMGSTSGTGGTGSTSGTGGAGQGEAVRPDPATSFDVSRVPSAPLHDRLGITVTEASAERCAGTMPVAGNTQPFGLLHGGASCVLAEGLASIAATIYAWPDRMAVGVDLNATHHRAVRSGTVRGVATPIHLGTSIATYEVAITDERDRRVCTVRLTCHLRAGGG
jgi:1,4-dihydroxy-2-naphthoyl-CoA hydrolase